MSAFLTPLRLLLVLLAVLLVANAFIRPGHPHFEAESLYGFWPLFGLIGGLALSVAAGAMFGPLLRRAPEETPEETDER